jgi:hypothetical protein
MTGPPIFIPPPRCPWEKWHDMIAKEDLCDLHTITHPEATFRSPIAFNPYHSAEALVLALSNVVQVFSDLAMR